MNEPTPEQFQDFCERLWDTDEGDPTLKLSKDRLRDIYMTALAVAGDSQHSKSGSVPAALALLAEWIDTEMDPEDDEYAPWMENFTARVRAALEGHKPRTNEP